MGEVVFSGPFDGGLGADFDFDLGLRADLDRDAALEGGVKPVKPAAFGPDAAAAASESSSTATRKKGFNLSKSSSLDCAPGGGAFAVDLAAGGAFTSGAPLGFGVSSVEGDAGKAASPFSTSCAGASFTPSSFTHASIIECERQ